MNPIKNNRGAALPLVLLVLTVAVMFGFASLTMMDAQIKFNVVEESSKKAIEYAEAGYNAYLWHLNDDSHFYNTAASDAMVSKYDADGNFIEVWNSFRDGEYRLEITKPSTGDEFVTIKSTGRTKNKPDIMRTIEVKIKKKTFMSYLCIDNGEATWDVGDQCHGPYHTNGKLITKEGGTFSIDLFDGEITTSSVHYPVFFDSVSYSGSLTDGIAGTTDRADAYRGGVPTQEGVLAIPDSNEQLAAWAKDDGTYFTGRTCIYLYVQGETGMVKVKDRTGAVVLDTPVEDITNGVIYVDKNANTTGKFNVDSGNIFISGVLKGRLTVAAANDIFITYKDPTDWSEPSRRPATGGITYSSGTVFNGGDEDVLSYYDDDKGIWTRDATGTDMLGLVANHDVMVLHYNWPRDPSSGDTYWHEHFLFWEYGLDVAPTDADVHAVLFALNGGFGFETAEGLIDGIINVFRNMGYITFWGSIVEQERYQVGESIRLFGSSSDYSSLAWGYQRRYAHDPRLVSDYPPHIPDPSNSGWEVYSWKEIN